MRFTKLSAPASAQCTVLLICCYMFRRNCHSQGAYTDDVKKYSNEVVLQRPCISHMQGKVKVKVKQSRYRPGVAQRVPGS
jgi:hypothetical protein